MIVDADMSFEKIKNENGKLEELTNETYSKFLTSKKRIVRKTHMKSYIKNMAIT